MFGHCTLLTVVPQQKIIVMPGPKLITDTAERQSDNEIE